MTIIVVILIIFVAILDGVFLFQKILSADKITKKYPNTQKYLHISQKSSTFAAVFVIFTLVNRNALAIVAQLVEQRIRNAWVAGSSPASGSKDIPADVFFVLCYFIYPTTS